MKEESGCSGEKRRAEWASLQPELVQLIADRVLSTSGVDEYMGMRAVCPAWRSAVAKPSPHAAVADLRFRPRQWVLLHGADDQEGRPLFLNVATGRFRRLRLPLLRDYIFVGASDGLLVLGARDLPHAARLLNPLTGDMLPFAAPIPPEDWVETAIVVGFEPTIIFAFEPAYGKYQYIPAYCSLGRGGDAVYSADPMGQLRAVRFHDAASNQDALFYLRSMVTYADNVYVLNSGGTLCKIVRTGGHWYAERILEVDKDYNVALVESAGKLLLIREQPEIIQVFSIDVKRKLLEPIESLGSSALFISHGNCMVVDADMLPSIKGNCIYSISFAGIQLDSVHVLYDLSDGKRRCFSGPLIPGDGLPPESDIIHEGPLSLAQTPKN
ncbi:hypothetical protein CFC21_044294 [Triticum aestivum]|uniref:KIB1-4 beta-propeller domain-containing protein n=2 Tax=Triticum aestivum TaxID=4565 RepID=A0A3B6G0I5_WHEAT|nr:hypothetical protein CFC21_044294 [Triticum aestivum]